MIRVVVGEDERFAQRSLSGPVRDFSEEIDLRVLHEALHLLQVALYLGNTLVPGSRVGRCVTPGRGPVARRPLRRHMLRTLRELKNVPLRDPDVLEQAPSGKRLARGLYTPERGRPVCDRVLEPDMGVALGEQGDEVVPQPLIGIGLAWLWLRRHGRNVGRRREPEKAPIDFARRPSLMLIRGEFESRR